MAGRILEKTTAANPKWSLTFSKTDGLICHLNEIVHHLANKQWIFKALIFKPEVCDWLYLESDNDGYKVHGKLTLEACSGVISFSLGKGGLCGKLQT